MLSCGGTEVFITLTVGCTSSNEELFDMPSLILGKIDSLELDDELKLRVNSLGVVVAVSIMGWLKHRCVGTAVCSFDLGDNLNTVEVSAPSFAGVTTVSYTHLTLPTNGTV